MFPLPVTISVHLARSCIPTIFPLGRSSQPHSHPDSAPRRLNAFVFPLRTGSIFFYHDYYFILRALKVRRAEESPPAAATGRGRAPRPPAAPCVGGDCAPLNPAGVRRRVAASNTATQREGGGRGGREGGRNRTVFSRD